MADGTVLPSSIETLAQLLAWRVRETPAGLAYRDYDASARVWRDSSWQDVGRRNELWCRGLDALLLSQSARIAILLPNGSNAVSIDLAALCSGSVPVPLTALDNPESIAYVLGDSQAEMLVVQDASQWSAIEALNLALPALRVVLVVGAPSAAALASSPGSARVVGLEEWLAGAATAERRAREPLAEDLAAVVYTSGTTGKPKGVMLTHRNVVENMKSVLQRVVPLQSDVFLSFLPLSHTFERTAGYYLAIACGSCVAHVRSVAQIAEDLKVIHPTVLISVPRIYERIFAKIQEQLQRSAFKRWLFELAVSVGWRRFCRRQGLALESDAPAWVDALRWPPLERLVARPLRAQLGGRLRVAVSGGAPLSPAIARCFLGLGVPLLQGYGMTETAPVISANAIDDNWPATVGRPLAGVEARIGENRELQVRGANVMKGYWKRPDDTQRAFTEDGWLRTGDQAAIEDGRIRILGRIKEIIVTSTGEKIAPSDLELAIAGDALFDQVFVLGENRPFLAVFVVLNPEQWQALAAQLGVESGAAGLAREEVRQALIKRVQAATRSFPRYAVPRVVRATLEPWGIQNGLMTATLKIKRTNLENFYRTQIDEIYRGRGAS